MKKLRKLIIPFVIMVSFILSGCNIELVATYDTIIIGSGISAMTAALDLVEKDKKVLIVEESGIIGGNKRLLSGGVTFLNLGGEDSVEQFSQDIVENNNDVDNFYTGHLVEQSSNIPAWLLKYNVELNKIVRMPGNSIARTAVSEKGESSGKETITKLEKAVQESKITLEYNTTVTNVSVNNAQGKKPQYTMTLEKKSTVTTAKTSTIVIAEDGENIYDSAVPIRTLDDLSKDLKTNIGMNKTPGMEILELLGGDYNTDGEMNIIDTYNHEMSVSISPSLRGFGAFLVNREGKRFVNEMNDGYDIIEGIIAQQDQQAYLIYDSKIRSTLNFLDDYYTENNVIKAASVGELADKIGVDENELYKTTINYREYSENNSDPDFERTFLEDFPVFQNADQKDNLYAIKVQPYMYIHPAYAEVTDKFEVMKKDDVLSGVYSIGDSAKGVLLDSTLPGMEITYAIVMGMDVATYIETYLATE